MFHLCILYWYRKLESGNYLNTISDQLFHPLDEVLIVFDRAHTSPEITDESDQEESNESSNDPNRVKNFWCQRYVGIVQRYNDYYYKT